MAQSLMEFLRSIDEDLALDELAVSHHCYCASCNARINWLSSILSAG